MPTMPAAESLLSLAAAAEHCTRCSLAATRTRVVFGGGADKAALMLIGEAPGREEDLQGLPFVGRSGRLVDDLLDEKIGVGRDRVYVANVVKCRPPDNRTPVAAEVVACRSFLEGQIDAVDPEVLITLGNTATRAILGSKAGITTLRGTHYPRGVSQVVPTFHPAAALRGGASVLAKMREDFGLARHLLDVAR